MMIKEQFLPDGARDGARRNTPKMIVVHAMGEYILDPGPIHARDFLLKLGYSAHALVEPDGQIIICRTPDQGAYHARGFNTDSLGIEYLVKGNHDYGSFLDAMKTDWVTHAQWHSGIDFINQWLTDFDTITEVVRHSDISPGRKVDPGVGFDWELFKQNIPSGYFE